jgi:hypothetical protein
MQQFTAIANGQRVRYTAAWARARGQTVDDQLTAELAAARRGVVTRQHPGTGLVTVAWDDGEVARCGTDRLVVVRTR